MFPVPYNSNQTGNNDFHGSNDRNFTAFRDVLQTFIIEDIADCRCNQRIEESPEKNSGIECEFSTRNSHGNAKKNSGFHPISRSCRRCDRHADVRRTDQDHPALVKQAPGVFLGRCANFVLGGQPHSYSFFVYADDEYREKEGKEYYKGQTLNELKLRDIQKNEYYQRFTGMKCDDPKHYDMVVNVLKTGVDGAVKMILDYVEQKESGSK